MRKLLFLFLFVAFSLTGFPQDTSGEQVKIYSGTTTNYVNLIRIIDDAHIHDATSVKVANYSNTIFTFDDEFFYKGNVSNTSDIIFKFDRKNGVIYSKDNFKILFIKDNQIFNGADVCMFTVEKNVVYVGTLTNVSNIVYTLDKPVDLYILACLISGFAN